MGKEELVAELTLHRCSRAGSGGGGQRKREEAAGGRRHPNRDTGQQPQALRKNATPFTACMTCITCKLTGDRTSRQHPQANGTYTLSPTKQHRRRRGMVPPAPREHV